MGACGFGCDALTGADTSRVPHPSQRQTDPVGAPAEAGRPQDPSGGAVRPLPIVGLAGWLIEVAPGVPTSELPPP